MAIRFIIGRAGSGKTWRCLEAIRARLRQNAASGNKLLLLVPEQASFQMERALIETPDLAGYTRCEVLSFQRLAYRIFADTSADPRRSDQTIGSSGRLMVIRRLIRREKSALQLFGRVADKPGLIKEVAATIDELMRENVAPETLATIAEQAQDSNALQSARLADLTRLYRAYLDYLMDDRIDPAQYLNLAAERLSACTWLEGAEVWVDGFAGFSAQESNLLAQIARRAASMEMTLLVDPAASAIHADEVPRESYSLFARTEQTLVRMRRDFRGLGIAVDSPVLLPTSGQASRFKFPELTQLEQCLFRSPGLSAAPPNADVICLNQMPDRRTEVAAVIAEIQRLTRPSAEAMRYRDMAIIVRDLQPYHDLIVAAMRAHGIPCFIDRRQPTAHHPLIELIRSLLAMGTDDCRLNSVRMSFKTGLLPIPTRDLDLLENYMIAHGLEGRGKIEQQWEFTRFFQNKKENNQLSPDQRACLAHINEIRAGWLVFVASWLELASQKAEQPGRTWAEGLFACLESIGAGQRLYQWADQDEADGRADQAEGHRQVWLDFVELLDEFVRALGSERMRVEEFRETLEAGLAEFNLGLAPPTLDQVLVGAVERSRHPNLRGVFILGFDEAHFPMRRAEDRLMGDDERELLAKAGVEVRPSRRRQILDERMLAYIALTRASDRVWISFARTADDGSPLKPSPYVDDVLAALPGLDLQNWEDPRRARKPLLLTRPSELAGSLAAEFRYRRPAQQEPDAATRSIWNSLYDTARHIPEWRQTLSRSLAGLKYRNQAALAPEMVSRAFKSPLAASVSRLERFAACPFAHFVEYTLNLRPRAQAQIMEVDLGTLSHAILETFVNVLKETKRNLGELEDAEIAEHVDTITAQVTSRYGLEMMLTDSRNAFLLDRSRGHLRRALGWQRDAARVGRFKPQEVEFPFGFTGNRMAPFQLTTPRGRTVLLRGRIDRIDLADFGNELLGTIIDYKRTTDRRLDLVQVYHGLTLQLVGYMLAIQQMGESLTGRPIRPVAGLYLPLLEPYKSVTHPRKEKESTYKWRGIADAAALNVLDNTVQPGTPSRFFSATLKKDGSPYATSDLTERDQLARVMAHVGRRMGELADSILDGHIGIEPYRLRRKMPCTFCGYLPICRYEIHTQSPRALESLGKADVLRRLEEQEGP